MPNAQPVAYARAETPAATSTPVSTPSPELTYLFVQGKTVTRQGNDNRITWTAVPRAIYYNLYFCSYAYSTDAADPRLCDYAGSLDLFRDRYLLLVSGVTGTTYLHKNVPQPSPGYGYAYHYHIQSCFSRSCPFLTEATPVPAPTRTPTPAPALAAPALRAQAAGAAAVALSWTAVDRAARYELWVWWDPGAGWRRLGGDSLTATAFAHGSLTAGTTYYYQIRALDAGGAEGPWSQRVQATPGALAAPALTATPGVGEITLTWTAVDRAARYELWVWWDTDTGWQRLGGDSLTATAYPHRNLKAGTTFYYQMRARAAGGAAGAWSQRVHATPGALPAPALTATPGAAAVALSWTAVDRAARYELWVWWDTDTGWRRIGGDLTETAYTHRGLTAGTVYFYAARAVNAAGLAGAWSQYLSAIPEGAPSTPHPPSRETFESAAPPGYTRITLGISDRVWGGPAKHHDVSRDGAVAYMLLGSLKGCAFADAEAGRASRVFVKEERLGHLAGYASQRVCRITSRPWPGVWPALRITHLRFYDESSPVNVSEYLYDATTDQYVAVANPAEPPVTAPSLPPPPASLGLDPFYTKYLDAGGIAVVAPARVANQELSKARAIMLAMISTRPDLLAAMVRNRFRAVIFDPSVDWSRGVTLVPELKDDEGLVNAAGIARTVTRRGDGGHCVGVDRPAGYAGRQTCARR